MWAQEAQKKIIYTVTGGERGREGGREGERDFANNIHSYCILYVCTLHLVEANIEPGPVRIGRAGRAPDGCSEQNRAHKWIAATSVSLQWDL